MSTQNFDSFGSPTNCAVDVLPGINEFVEGFVGYQKTSVNILETVEQHPDSVLANIYAGMLWMFLERPEAVEKSLPFAENAEALKPTHPREIALLHWLQAWQAYDFKKVLKLGRTICEDYPQDLAFLKMMQYHAFNAAEFDLMLELALAGEEANAHLAPVHSMIAFGYEQQHKMVEAAEAAERALSIDRNEPWAHHALAHVHLSQGTANEGRTMMLESSPSWENLNSFMFTHNWWHIALFDLALGETTSALEIYDQRCWGVQPDYSQDQIGAVSLLARLELMGIEVGDRWEALQPFLETRNKDVLQPFLTLQYLYGLARGGSPKCEELIEAIREQASNPLVSQDKNLWVDVAIPAAEGLVAHAHQDYERASTLLGSVRRSLIKIGGSHAQRDLFEQILLDARLRSGQWEAARKTIEHRMQWEPDNPVLKTRLNTVYKRLNVS